MLMTYDSAQKTVRRLLRFRLSYALFSLVGIVLLIPAAYSQVVTATLTGTVTDSTGASIPNAAVTVTQISTGVARSTSRLVWPAPPRRTKKGFIAFPI